MSIEHHGIVHRSHEVRSCETLDLLYHLRTVFHRMPAAGIHIVHIHPLHDDEPRVYDLFEGFSAHSILCCQSKRRLCQQGHGLCQQGQGRSSDSTTAKLSVMIFCHQE